MVAEGSIDMAVRFLANRYKGEATGLAELGAGDWSRAFAFRVGGRDLVIRFGRHREDFEADRAAGAFAGPNLPVPTVCEIGEAPEGFYAISERRFGRFLESLEAGEWQSLFPALMRALDSLRAIQPSGSGAFWAAGATGASQKQGWNEWLLQALRDSPGARVSGWRARLAQNAAANDVFVRGETALRSLLPVTPDGRHIVHRDLLNRNVLVDEHASRIEAVFDWGCSVAGDFVYEVAWFTFWESWYPALQSIGFRQSTLDHYTAIGLRVDNFVERLALYELHIGLEHMAYAAFSHRDADLTDITRKTSQVLETLP